MRKLATIRRVAEIHPIEGADKIELAVIDGWQCVVKKGEFKPGNVGVYFEIDSFLDHTQPAFSFLASKAIKWNGLEGARIKTIRLKGQLSQGLLLPLDAFQADEGQATLEDYLADEMGAFGATLDDINYDLDLDKLLNVQKWEKLLAANLAGTARGNFPSFLRKTDQERVQNLPRVFEQYGDDLFQVTQKLDGSSLTAYIVSADSKFYQVDETNLGAANVGVCSRNLDLVDTPDNAFWKTAKQHELHRLICEMMAISARPALAVQGEMVGRGIQDNHEMVETDLNEFYAFDIFDIDAGAYLAPNVVEELCESVGLSHVPVIHSAIKLKDYAADRADLLKKVVGPSIRQKIGEGKVFKLVDPKDDFSFKGISDDYLEKTGN